MVLHTVMICHKTPHCSLPFYLFAQSLGVWFVGGGRKGLAAKGASSFVVGWASIFPTL